MRELGHLHTAFDFWPEPDQDRIDRMAECLSWLRLVSHDEASIIMGRLMIAPGGRQPVMKPVLLARAFDVDQTEIEFRFKCAISRITRRLNQETQVAA